MSEASDAVTLQSWSVTWSLSTSSVRFVGALAERLPPLTLASPGLTPQRAYVVSPLRAAGGGIDGGDGEGNGEGRFLVRGGARRPVELEHVGAAADWVAGDLQRFLAQREPARLLVHAGAVAWRGRAVLFPGRSGSGKSRWVEALLRLGADYLSDDLIALDAAGQVEGFARPLALRRADGSFERRPAGELGAAVVTAPLPVAAVVFASYRANAASALLLEPISPAQCTVALLRHAVAARRRLELAATVLPAVAAAAVSARGTRGDASLAAERLLDRLESTDLQTRVDDQLTR